MIQWNFSQLYWIQYFLGLPNRLLSYERFLELYPEYIEKVMLLQVAVPSRTDVKEYNGTKWAKYKVYHHNINMIFEKPLKYFSFLNHLSYFLDLKDKMDQLVGEINGRFSTPRWSPIRYIFGCINQVSAVNFFVIWLQTL